MVSFVEFILRFRHERSGWGDLARDVAQDKAIRPGWGVDEVVAHIKSETQWEPVLRTLDEMVRAYEKLKPALKVLDRMGLKIKTLSSK